MHKIVISQLAILCIIFITIIPCAAFADEAAPLSFKTAKEAIAAASEFTEEEFDIGATDFTVDQLSKIRDALPLGTRFTFSFKWCGATISSTDTAVDLNASTKKSVSADQLRELIALLPDLKSINVVQHRELGNKDMIPLVEEYTDIEFTWLIRLGRSYTLSSAATAYSTMKHASTGEELTSKKCEVLKYAPHLRALDLGHHQITTLDFLNDLPELRILILADNKIEDISQLASLTHLQYAELFFNKITDITPLSGLTELLDLNLCWNKGLTDLSALDQCESLERLWASYTGISDEEKEAFKEKHPGCETNFKVSSSTAGGWRDHPRYKQYISMFKSHTWKEFE